MAAKPVFSDVSTIHLAGEFFALAGISQRVFALKRSKEEVKNLKVTPHNVVCGVFHAGNALLKLEIHKVFLRFCDFFRRKIRRNPLLPNCAVLP